MKRVVFAANLLFEDGAILVVGSENHAHMFKVFPIARRSQPNAHTVAGDLRIGQVVGLANLRDAAIFNAIGFQLAGSHEGLAAFRLGKVNSVVA